MNIFKILSDNDGKIHEPSITSVLAYLLDADEDHGLSSLLLKSFVEECNKAKPGFSKGINWEQYDVVAEAKLELDDSVGKKQKTTDFDVLVLFYPDKKANAPSHVLGIENKIKDSSRREDQLQHEWSALKNRYTELKESNLFLCFLTPTSKSDDDFENVPSEQKIHLVWKSATNESSEHRSVLEMLVNILQKEEIGEIDPIPGDSKFLIKSLLAFIRADFKAKVKDSLDEANEKRNYGGKPLWKHLIGFLERFNFSDDLRKDRLGQEFAEYVERQSGTKVLPITLNCQLTKVIVNDKNRQHYGVTLANHERYDLLYYPDPKDTNIVRKYDSKLVPDSVKVYWKDAGTDVE